MTNERQFRRKIRDILGPAAVRIEPSSGSMPGVADICYLLNHQRCVWIELKRARGTLRPSQRLFSRHMAKHWHRYVVLEACDDATTNHCLWHEEGQETRRVAFQRLVPLLQGVEDPV